MFAISNDRLNELRQASSNDNIDVKTIRLKADVLERFIKERSNDPNPEFSHLVETANVHLQLLRHSLQVRLA